MKKKWFRTAYGIILMLLAGRAFGMTVAAVDISGTRYFPAVKEAISKAEQSILVVMFSMDASESRQDSKPNQLIDELIKAKDRGVDVEVILDQNVDLMRGSGSPEWETRNSNARAFRRLKDARVKVFYDESTRYAHAKGIIIDKKIIIMGSTNWSEPAFDSNIELDVMITSVDMANGMLSYLKTIKLDEGGGAKVESTGQKVRLSRQFLTDSRLLPFLVKGQAERALDVYLYFLWKFDGNAESRISVFYDDLARHLGIYDEWAVADFRRQINKVCKQLEDKFKLIKFATTYGEEAEVTLLGYGDSGLYTIPDKGFIEIPDNYFLFKWNQELSERAKFCYLINLANAGDGKPYWSGSVKTLTEEFGGVGQDVINKGMGELRRQRLLDVRSEDLAGKLSNERSPNKYRLLDLYNPGERETELNAVELKYGKDIYAQARKYAEIVFEENNPEAITDIITSMREYGEAEVKRVFNEIARKSADDPERNYLYVTRIMGKPGAE